jgi:glycosyltransferase involved in cell wall biosynthesis
MTDAIAGPADVVTGAPGTRRRIVILTEDSKPALGGIAEYLHQLALAASVSHDVLIVTSVLGAERLNPAIPFRYRETRWFRTQWTFRGDGFMPSRRWNSLVWRLRRPSEVRALLAGIHAERPDSTYVLGRLSPVTHPWCAACRDLGLPYLVIAHGLELIEPLPRAADTRRRADIGGAAFWFANSNDTAQRVSALGVREDFLRVLRPGAAVPDVVVSDEQRATIRQRLGVTTRRFVLTVCSLRPRKGVDLVVRALAALGASAAEVTVVVAGTGPEEQPLRNLAHELGVADRVILAGAVDEPTKAALFSECEFFVLPTRAMAGDVEGFGIVFLEAGWYGKAVIGGRNGGVPEAVEDRVTGLVVDTGDAGELTSAMRQLLSDPAFATRLGSHGAARVRRDFSWTDRARVFTGEVDRIALESESVVAALTTPTTRLRSYAGTTSNRLVSTAYVMGELARAGRATDYLARSAAPPDLRACSEETLKWLGRAFAAGRDGGAAANYHLVHGWAAAYPEITGYCIPTLLQYAVSRARPALAAQAARAGDWLARTRLPTGAICRKLWFAGNTAPSVFNTAQAVEGWCALTTASLAERSELQDWRALAREAGDWLVSQQEPDGRWVRNAFNGVAHSYYARVAAPLAQLGQITGVSRYADAARAGADWVTSRQTPSGWFRDAGFTNTEAPTTHTIGYVIDGLLTCGILLDEDRYVDAADRAGRALLQCYEKRGRLPGRLAGDWRPEGQWRCLTGDAQIALTWHTLASQTGESRYARAAASMAEDIRATVRVDSGWPEISGAIQGSSPPWGEYDQFAYPTHAAKFALDLFALLDQ